MPSTLDLYKKMTALPQGKRLFSVAFSQKAPYFASIHLEVQEMKPHLGQIRIPKRRSVKNHIGTIQAIAACNGLEAAMGLLAEATCPDDMRWLPKGMEVSYLDGADLHRRDDRSQLGRSTRRTGKGQGGDV